MGASDKYRNSLSHCRTINVQTGLHNDITHHNVHSLQTQSIDANGYVTK